MSTTRNTSNYQQQEVFRQQSFDRSDNTGTRIRSEECLDSQLEGKYDQTQRLTGGIGTTHKKPKKENLDGLVILYGGMTDKEKDKAVNSFQNDPNIRVFVGSMHAAGVGLTLTKASQCLFTEFDWTPGIMDQAADRIHRIGQVDSVLIQYLALEDSLDSKKVGMLLTKRQDAFKNLDKPLEVFDLPLSEPELAVVGPQGPATDVFAILARLGIKDEEVPF
jgi:hypothetical protein